MGLVGLITPHASRTELFQDAVVKWHCQSAGGTAALAAILIPRAKQSQPKLPAGSGSNCGPSIFFETGFSSVNGPRSAAKIARQISLN
jgi:hypothetical protein